MTSVVKSDDSHSASISVSDIAAELRQLWNLAKDNGLRPNFIEYPSCMSDAQLEELKSGLPSELLTAVQWIRKTNDSSSETIVVHPTVRVPGTATYISFCV